MSNCCWSTERDARGERGGVPDSGLYHCGRSCARPGAGAPFGLAGLQRAAVGTLFLANAAFKRAGEKHLAPFEMIYQTDPRRSATVTLWLCFSEFEGFTILLPEEY